MIQLPGYTVTRKIHAGEKTVVFGGVRETDGTPVVLKMSVNEYPTLKELSRDKREYEIASKLDMDGVVKSLALEKYRNSHVLVAEDFQGVSLDRVLRETGLDVREFIRIAVSLTETLGEIHRRGVIHKDIKPSNVIVNRETGMVKLTDFGISTFLPREVQNVMSPTHLEGTLAYMSPEQTGRMNRALDYRSDYYSLGATFYEMLTGVLPFRSRDPMELVHSHIARLPKPPHVVDASIPRSLSDIVMKLLQKNAENRYQSDFGLKADLEEAERRLDRGESVGEFIVGAMDVSNRFRIPQKLYGRDKEIEKLMGVFEKVRRGTARTTLVAGFSGIGKSALINEIHKPIVATSGYFAAGKFDQFQRDIPYRAVILAFKEIARQLLTESDERARNWKEKLLAALEGNGRLITDVIPEMEHIIGPQPPVAELPPMEAQNRFNLVFKRFVGVFTRREHPLVLFLDDLQWADSATLDLLKLILSDGDIEYLHILGAYRDNEVSPTHPFILTLDEIRKTGAKIDVITLKPLELRHVHELVSETLRNDGPEAAELAGLVHRKTEGNPFFVNELLKTLYQEKLFNFERGQWVWELERIKEHGITDNVVLLVADKIRALGTHEQNVLKLASCIGNKFDLAVLALVNEAGLVETAELLRPALELGMLLPESDSYKYVEQVEQAGIAAPGERRENGEVMNATYRFLHDRVQQAASSLMEESERIRLHRKVGRHLLDGANGAQLEERIVDVVNHLNNAAELITTLDERIELAGLNLRAGIKARTSNAYGPAMKYLAMAMGLLPADSWHSHYELTRDVYTEKMEVHYLLAEYETMYEIGQEVLRHVRTPLEKVKTYELRTVRFESENKMMEALWVAREILGELGVSLPKRPTQIHVALGLLPTMLRLALKKEDYLENRANMTDPEKLAAMKILAKVSGAAYLGSKEYLALIVFSMIRLSIKYGNTEHSGFGYVLYSILMCGALGLMETGYRFGQMGLRIIQRFGADALYAKALGYYETFTHHHTKPLAETVEPLLTDSFKGCIAGGDQETAAYVLQVGVFYKFCKGANLEEMDRDAAKYIAHIRKLNQEQTEYLTLPWHRATLMFLGREDLADKDGRDVPTVEELIAFNTRTNNNLAAFNIYSCCEMYYYVFRDYEKAEYYSNLAHEKLDTALSLYLQVWHFFHRALIMIARAEQAASGKRSYLKIARENLKLLRTRARSNAGNHAHKVDLVRAELARLAGRSEQAARFYDSAATSGGEFIQEEALACELAARFYRSEGRDMPARSYMREAMARYERWGSEPRVKALQEEFPGLASGVSPSHGRDVATTTSGALLTTSDGRTAGELDIAAVMAAGRAVSGETNRERLLEIFLKTVVENAGAERGQVVLNGDTGLEVGARGDASRVVVPSPGIPAETGDIALSVLNYVARTQKDIVLQEAGGEGEFTGDEYIREHQPKSVLCAPIMDQGILMGMVYLENNLTAGAFTPARLRVVNLLAAQAAVSLRAAEQYAKLEQRVLRLENDSDEFGAFLRAVADRESADKAAEFDFRREAPGRFPVETLDALRNPLAELIRNAYRHGIESPEARRRRGKSAHGRIAIALREEEGRRLVVCEDDGAGLDTEKITAAAVRQKLITSEQAERLSEGEVRKLIFTPGFSTASAARGMGLDGVRADLKALGAVLVMATRPGRYTRFAIRLPAESRSSLDRSRG